MPTKLNKPVIREVEVTLRAAGYRDGFVAKVTDEGVYTKPKKARWTSALLATWGDILGVAAQRRAHEVKLARAEKRRAKKSLH